MDKIQLKQWMIALLAMVTLLSILGITLFFVFKSERLPIKDKELAAEFQYPIDAKGLESQWQERMSKLLADQQAKGESLEQALKQFNENKEKQVEIILEQQQQLQVISSRLQQLEERPISEKTDNDVAVADEAPQDKFQIQVLALSQSEKTHLPKTAQNYVPSGSFVEAILLGGLDAHTGVTSQSDPHPVLLRVLDDGVLPKNHNSQLNHCHIIAAGFGDISSERAYIRLERMSCEQNGFFTDYPVYGYVTGPDGKDGIKGRVVLRDKAVVTRAFMGGFLSGLSDVASQGLTNQSITPLGSVETIKGGDALAYSGVSGAGNAMELYARYNIKRAEQYQPVIEIPAGTKINVVFNRGFYLDGLAELDPAKMQSSKTHADFLINNQGNDHENTDFTAQ